MNKIMTFGFILGAAILPVLGAEVTVADFEGAHPESWKIPDWALEKADHVAKEISISKDQASKGTQSLKVTAAFPGGTWNAAAVELEENLDFSEQSKISVDIYLPKDAPEGLYGNICVTYGSKWTWAEQVKNVPLVPGKWTTVEADIAEGSKDWKKVRVDGEFRSDIRKLNIRVISDKKPAYSGDFYFDNVRAN
jgi:mannanase-like protein